jgi:hypothetical protein
MSTLENPVIRLFFIFAGGFLFTSLYIMFTGFLPAPYQWFPFGTYPGIGSLQYIGIFTISTFISGVLWWIALTVHGRNVKNATLERYGIVKR